MSVATDSVAVARPVLGHGTSAAASSTSATATATATAPVNAAAETRVVALDGIRGLMTIMVLASHFFAEVPHGWRAFSLGWVAVLTFFALSGFLVGRLILDKSDRANFYTVFYVRRFCRTIPVYVFCVLVIFAALYAFSDRPWANAHHHIPLWSYLTFWQNFHMVDANHVGQHWLAPTWTLTVEEHFYLIAPALLLLTPRRHLLAMLIIATLLSVAFRAYIFYWSDVNALWGLALLPGRADALFCGIIAAIVYRDNSITWRHYDLALRVAPIVLLLATFVLRLVDGDTGQLTQVFGLFFVAVASSIYILSIARGAPEADRLTSRSLVFCGHNSYSIYLTHLLVLGLMHGLIFDAAPDVHTPAQILVTFAAIPVALFVGWVFTRLVEEPITAYGRSWKWSEKRRGEA